MSQPGGLWNHPEGTSSHLQNPHEPALGIRQQFNNVNVPQMNQGSSGQYWASQQQSYSHNVGFSSNHHSNSMAFPISHPQPSNFQKIPPPSSQLPVQNIFPNFPTNVPPPPFQQNVSPYNISGLQSTSAQVSNMPPFPPNINFNRPPPSFMNTYRPYSESPSSRNSKIHAQYPIPGMLGTTNLLVTDKVENQQQLEDKASGCQKLEKWLQLHKKHIKSGYKPCAVKEKSPVQVWDFVNRLKEMQELVNSLSAQVSGLTTISSTTDEPMWEASKSICDTLKEKLATDFGRLLEDCNLQDVRKKLQCIRRKRARIKRAKARKFEQNQLLQQQWDEKSKNIDKWQERLRLKIQEEVKEKKRKAAADHTLSKVTREIQDATRLIDTMLGLEKLRLIRRDAAQKRGDSDVGESRQSFEDKIKDMTRLVKAQLECYKEEEAKLKQVLKSEEEEKSKLECQSREEKARLEQEEKDAKLKLILFGPEETLSHTDPLFPFNQYYKQAHHNMSAFLQIRQEWDAYVVPRGTPASSCVPNTWVTPDPPSSSLWSAALQ